MCSAVCLIHLYICILFGSKRWHWREHSPPTNVTLVQIWASTPSPCGLLLLMVLFFSPRGFSLGSVVFPSPQKPTFPYFQFNHENCFVHVLLVHVPLLVLLIIDYYIERYLNTCTEGIWWPTGDMLQRKTSLQIK